MRLNHPGAVGGDKTGAGAPAPRSLWRQVLKKVQQLRRHLAHQRPRDTADSSPRICAADSLMSRMRSAHRPPACSRAGAARCIETVGKIRQVDVLSGEPSASLSRMPVGDETCGRRAGEQHGAEQAGGGVQGDVGAAAQLLPNRMAQHGDRGHGRQEQRAALGQQECQAADGHQQQQPQAAGRRLRRRAAAMNLHEYQSKELFAQYAIPVPKGQVANSPEEAVAAAEIGRFAVGGQGPGARRRPRQGGRRQGRQGPGGGAKSRPRPCWARRW
jgi:hypothetical protein